MRKWLLLAVALAVLLAGWRPAPKEPEGLGLVRVLGVDGAGPVTLTAVCGGDDQGDQDRGWYTGEDFAQALEGLPWSGQKELSLTSVSYIIVGRDVELKEILLAVLRNEELGASATVWLAEEGAVELLNCCYDPASGLDLLARRGIEAPTVVEALAALEHGEVLTLPLLAGDVPVLIDWEEWRGLA
ncbi:MAG: hypothetical protein K2O11_10050 [Oscillospiraceae bacterium]|nr:hypothetical protein [Oscillospiraceae bacterium]